jgi:hypothetical protein
MGMKRDLGLAALSLLLSGMTYANYTKEATAQELTCADIDGCGEKGSCEESGTPAGCVLNCKSGHTVNCKPKVEG